MPVFWGHDHSVRPQPSLDFTKFDRKSIMIFLGSGGHTGEMIRIIENSNIKEVPKTWVVSSNDSRSMLKSKDLEIKWSASQFSKKIKPKYLKLHRARNVQEKLFSSIINTLISFVDTFCKLITFKPLPDVLLLNGPGTCVPLAYILFTFKVFGLANTRIIYIESLARVNKLSLTGFLLLPIADRFIVQWEPLLDKYRRAEYYGILI